MRLRTKRRIKASLSLSINAIVVLILAITMLGLGLGFMRNIFGGAIEEFEDVRGEVKKQMIEQMKESEKIVEFSRPKVELKAGEKKQIFIGFKNELQADTMFKINEYTATQLGATSAGCLGLSIEYKVTTTTVASGDVVVVPMNIKADSTAAEQTCFYDFGILLTDSTWTEGATQGIIKTKRIELTVDVII